MAQGFHGPFLSESLRLSLFSSSSQRSESFPLQFCRRAEKQPYCRRECFIGHHLLLRRHHHHPFKICVTLTWIGSQCYERGDHSLRFCRKSEKPPQTRFIRGVNSISISILEMWRIRNYKLSGNLKLQALQE